MFGLLKDKLKSFVDTLTKREEAKPAEKKEEIKQPIPKPETRKPEPLPEPKHEIKRPEPKPEAKRPEPKAEKKPEPKIHEEKKELPRPAPKPEPKPIPKELPRPEPKEIPKPAPLPAPEPAPVPAVQEKKGGFLGVNLSLESKVRSLFSSQITIKEKDVDDLLEQLELDMLEADVAYEVAELLKGEIRKGLVGKAVDKGKLNHAIGESIRAALLSVMESEKPDVIALAKGKEEKPYIILFLGPNGAGKTTTIAKFATLLRSRGLSCVLALADTFRAASQEQGNEWATRLDIKAIGGPYGSDAAAVAYNAREHAKSKGLDVVLIDSAGRQETSKNLMEEIAKINRVVKPDFRMYVGEAIAGNSLVEQVREFDKYVGVNGVILTKADVDAKGGTAISVYKATGKPILFIGVGQGEGDLREFDAKWVVGNIVGDSHAS
ncbi:MAG: signal recognition particle-docking protein FtsY [Candidatus Micrarchaeia archaeon]|jgi:fused signal recognition particle receptor